MGNKINIVLNEPEIPQNTGNISRTCSVIGAALHIIRPIGFEISDKTLKRAGLDYWDTLEVERGKPRFAKNSTKVYRRPTIDLCIEFCEKHNIEPREHGLAYASFYPKWLSDASVEEVKRESERRFSEIAERYADKIRTIEVTNEMDRKSAITTFYEEPDFINWNFKTADNASLAIPLPW